MATITKRGKSFLIRVYDGYDLAGKQITKSTTWTPPADLTEKQAEKEVQLVALRFEEKVKNGMAGNGKIRFADFASQWLSLYASPQLRIRTVARYEELLVRINAFLGHMPLEKIRPTHLLDFYKKLEGSPPLNASYICTIDLKALLKKRQITKAAFSKLSGVSLTTLSTAFQKKPITHKSAAKICSSLDVNLSSIFVPSNPNETLSPTTIHHYHSLISKILNDAVQWQFIPYNPCWRIATPKATSADIEYFDDEQAKLFLKRLQSEPGHYRRAFTLDLLTGLRRGELLGLEWTDINFVQKTMRISRTSQYLPRLGVFTDTTKNDSSKRVVMISDQIVRVLQEQFQWQQMQKHLLGDNWIDSGRVITMPNGSLMRPDHFSKRFKKFIVKNADLANIHLHSLRHTYASICIAKGEALTAVAAQLGHASVATTAKIYAHEIKSAQASAANTIGDLFEDCL